MVPRTGGPPPLTPRTTNGPTIPLRDGGAVLSCLGPPLTPLHDESEWVEVATSSCSRVWFDPAEAGFPIGSDAGYPVTDAAQGHFIANVHAAPSCSTFGCSHMTATSQ